MEIVVKSELKTGTRGLYRITYNKGYVYCGSFVNKPNHVIGETYFGSSALAKFLGLRKENVLENVVFNISNIKLLEVFYILEEQKREQPALESKFILSNAERLGVYKSEIFTTKFTEEYRAGLLLNRHSNSCEHLQTSEVRKKVIEICKKKGVLGISIRKRLEDKEEFRKSCRKGVATRKERFGSCFSESCKEAFIKWKNENPDVGFGIRSVEFHDKGVSSRLENNSYKTGAAKVAKTISGKQHFVCKKISIQFISSGEIKEFNSIIEAEKYLDSVGIHCTRATISQGLKRCGGFYQYKNSINFKYL